MTHRQWHDLKQQCPHSSERQRVYKHVSLAIEVGDQVRELRTHLGLKQQELAELVGTSQSMIARLENGG